AQAAAAGGSRAAIQESAGGDSAASDLGCLATAAYGQWRRLSARGIEGDVRTHAGVAAYVWEPAADFDHLDAAGSSDAGGDGRKVGCAVPGEGRGEAGICGAFDEQQGGGG